MQIAEVVNFFQKPPRRVNARKSWFAVLQKVTTRRDSEHQAVV